MEASKGCLWSRWNAESSSLGEKVGRERARLGRRSREERIMVGMGCDAKGEVEMFVATQLLNMRSQVVIWIGRGEGSG